MAAFLLAPLALLAQPDSLVYNQLEKLLLQPGTTLHIKTDSLGEWEPLLFTAITVEEKPSGRRLRGLLMADAPHSYDGYVNWPGRCLLDSADAAGLLRALEYYRDALQQKNLKRVEAYTYRSSNDVTVVLENRFEFYHRWFLYIGRRYHRQPRVVPGTEYVLRAVRLAELDGLIRVLRLFLAGTP